MKLVTALLVCVSQSAALLTTRPIAARAKLAAVTPTRGRAVTMETDLEYRKRMCQEDGVPADECEVDEPNVDRVPDADREAYLERVRSRIAKVETAAKAAAITDEASVRKLARENAAKEREAARAKVEEARKRKAKQFLLMN